MAAPKDDPRNDLLETPRLQPAPVRAREADAALHVPAGKITIDQYLTLRGVLEHRRAARRAFAGAVRVATVEEFDRIFAGVGGR